MTDAAEVRISRSRGEADAAKARLMGTVEEVKIRLAPGKLASDAVQNAKNKSIVVADDTVTAVKDRPAMAAGIATAAALLIARRPLFAAVSRLWGGGDHEDNRKTARPRNGARTKEDVNG